MRKLLALLMIAGSSCLQIHGQEKFPDGKLIPDWFRKYDGVDILTLGKQYRITDYGVVNDSVKVQTEEIQKVIDRAEKEGGGVVIVPRGTFQSGALFFKPKTHLYLEEEAVLKGSDDISRFPVRQTRMEGQTLKYFPALINADHLDGFTISGKGKLDGNGLRYWKSFWLRREVNSDCTNMDELRPRIIYLSNCKNVQIDGVTIANSPFWTTHFYKCSHLKLMNLRITSPHAPVKAPSTDAIDLDVCDNVLVKNCYISVCDDAVALKGGKGPWADKAPENGGNCDIIIEDCTYGYCHSALTCGSESVYNRNIIFRRSTVDGPQNLLRLKMRPDTPQKYEYILVEDIKGSVSSFIGIAPWTQFYDLKGRKDIPVSYANHITMRNIDLDCSIFFNIKKSDQYRLSDFHFENLTIRAKKGQVDKSVITSFTMNNVKVNTTDREVYVAKYKHDKACAISYTFDDGLAEQYTLVFPELERRGFKATFGICDSKVNRDDKHITDTTRVTWTQLKEMSDKGHEITNHGWAHRNFSRFPIEIIREDILKNDSAIFACTGVMPRTFIYPNNNRKEEGKKIADENRVGTRTKQRSIGSKSTPQDLEKWVNTLIATNDWGVGMTHGLTYGYDAFRNPQRLWDHWDQVKAKEDKIWVGTLREVSSYIKQRENIQLDVVKNQKGLQITPVLALDKEIFIEPLTMVIAGDEMKKISVKQGKRKLKVQKYANKVTFDFDPYGETILVTIK